MSYEEVDNKIDKNTEEKINLIRKIMSSYLATNSARPEGWHSEKFDYLYDRSLSELRILSALCKST